jgi:exopolysaccharide production protein ExoQ
MAPQLALAMCVVGVIWLVTRDVRKRPSVSQALWIPLAWMAIIGSRLVSEWLSGSAYEMTSPDAYLEGSAVDRNVFLGLMVLGGFIVLRRVVSWEVLFRKNIVILLFFVFGLASVSWSDFPLTAFKRWQKVLGHVIMALVVLTERDREEAFKAVFRRCAYVLIPLSVLFLKYYPDLGRSFSLWTGEAYNVGVTTNKNALGNLCMIMGLFFLASLFERWRDKGRFADLDRWIDLTFLMTIGWLLYIAHSASSVAAVAIGAVVIIGLQVRTVERHFTGLCIGGAVTVAVLQMVVNVKDSIVLALGRDTTLTGRTELWEKLGTMHVDPLVGAGFESFWLGPRVEELWRIYWWQPNQAHNGYYEMYLNLGAIGVFLQIGMILACYAKARREIKENDRGSAAGTLAQFSLAFVLALVAFNLTDATFKATNLSFFVFFLVAIHDGMPWHVGRGGPLEGGSTRNAGGIHDGRVWESASWQRGPEHGTARDPGEECGHLGARGEGGRVRGDRDEDKLSEQAVCTGRT